MDRQLLCFLLRKRGSTSRGGNITHTVETKYGSAHHTGEGIKIASSKRRAYIKKRETRDSHEARRKAHRQSAVQTGHGLLVGTGKDEDDPRLLIETGLCLILSPVSLAAGGGSSASGLGPTREGSESNSDPCQSF